jgi:hypothetical protein
MRPIALNRKNAMHELPHGFPFVQCGPLVSAPAPLRQELMNCLRASPLIPTELLTFAPDRTPVNVGNIRRHDLGWAIIHVTSAARRQCDPVGPDQCSRRATHPCRTSPRSPWFAHDSPLEGDGFELSVPRQKDNVFEAPQPDSAIPGEAIAYQMAAA